MSKRVKEMIGGCCVCSDERGWSENPLVYCDGANCNVAVHQACYGIIRVPSGPWFCRKCESQERVARVKCDLCPQRAGALKRTDSGGWCHVVCALYIPEACFGNVQTMEPIVLNAVPPDKFNKTCYICEEQKRDTKATAGACMQCNKANCKQYFHVTCAQAQGLLCEVMGSYGNVTYCGYCSHHNKKLKNHSNVKTIPAFKPIPSENGTSDSSPEKSNPMKPDMTAKLSNKLAHATPSLSLPEEKKSPPVDQSVSSTSDHVPLSVNCGERTNGTQVKQEPGINSSQVSDVSSAISPSGGGGSDHSSHEPSSSVTKVTLAGSITSKKHPDKTAASSSTEHVDVEADEDIDVQSPSPEANKSIPMSKRQRSNSRGKAKILNKKQKSGKLLSSSASRVDRIKKISKKRRESGGSAKDVSTKASLQSPSTSATALPGHHDYCGNTFGGSPFFQSLGAARKVSIPNFYTNDANNPQCEPSDLILPPKSFPSMSTSASNRDRSQEIPLTMEQLLEHQWEQGAQFLMQQGEHFDISSLLNCLHKLKGENRALEDQVKELSSRRDHLMMVNARLALPLSHFEPNLDGDTLPVVSGIPGPGGDCGNLGGDSGASSVVPLSNHSKASSSGGSIEDISSPDDVQTPKLTPVHIPPSSAMVVEDIVSPVDTDQKSLLPTLKLEADEKHSGPTFSYTNQIVSQQPLMYSAVNPPPPSLTAINTMMSSKSSPISSPSLPPPLTMVTPSSSSSSLLSPSSSSSLLPPPLLDQSHIPGMSRLSIGSKENKTS